MNLLLSLLLILTTSLGFSQTDDDDVYILSCGLSLSDTEAQNIPTTKSRDTSINIPIKDIPMSIEVINADFLDNIDNTYRVNRSPSANRTQTTSSSSLPAGYLYCPATDESERIVVPLQNTYVVMDITPGISETTIVQEFTNTTESTLKATYLFPLPSDATVTNMELHFGDRIISSKVQEKQIARETYNAAKASGKKAALIEQHLPNLFSTAVANFQAGETVAIHISYVEDIPYKRDGYAIRFPMLANNKYFPQPPATETIELKRTSSKRINPPTHQPYEEPSYDPTHLGFSPNHVIIFDIAVSGIPIKSINSGSHDLLVEQVGDSTSITLADTLTIPDRDFLLNLEIQQIASTQATIVSSKSNDINYGLLTLFPPKKIQQKGKEVTPRDIIFLIDHSGSMSGERMKNTRRGVIKCLDRLRPNDKFNIVIFDDTFEAYSTDLVPATFNNLDKATSYVRTIKAEGGTVMQPALKDCIQRFSSDENRSKLIVFLTDGDVGDEHSLISLLENEIGDVRLFTFGIGTAPNEFLIKRMAEAGRGQSRFIHSNQSIASGISDLFDTLNTPVLSDIELTFFDANNTPIELLSFPYPIADLFLNSPVQVSYRSEDAIPTNVVMRANRGNEVIYETYKITTEGEPHPGIEFLFGRKWINQLQSELYLATTEEEREALKAEMTEIAVLFQLVTEFTSRVAVENTPSSPLSSPQYTTTSYNSDEDIFVLSPFQVDTSEDTGWRSTNSTAGTTLNTAIKDIPMSIEVINSDFLDDIQASDFDEALSYSAGVNLLPQQESYTDNTFNIDRRTASTPIDIHTVERIELQSSPTVDTFNAASPFGTSNIMRVRPYSTFSSEIGYTAGNNNFSNAWVDHNQPIGNNYNHSFRIIASHIEDNRNQNSVYATAQSNFGDSTRINASFSNFKVNFFGKFRNASTSIVQSFGKNVYTHYSFSRSTSDLAKEPRFLIGDTNTQNSDFSNASQLYSTVNFDQRSESEHLLRNSLSFKAINASHDIVISLRHLDRDESSTLLQDRKITNESETEFTDLAYTYKLSILDEALRVIMGQKLSQTKSDLIKESQSTLSSNIGLSWDINSEITLKYNYANAEQSQLLFQQPYRAPSIINRTITPSEFGTTTGSGHDFGAAFDFFDNKLSGSLTYYQADRINLLYRDWSIEALLNREYQAQESTLLAPATYSTITNTRPEGFSLNLNIQPTRSVSVILNAYTDWTDDTPTIGGKTKIAGFAIYRFQEGFLKELRIGGGFRYRDTMRYNDGYTLPEHLLIDFLIDYQFNLFDLTTTRLSLNLKNLTEEDYQQTRFNTPKGLETFISLKTEF